MDNIKTVVAALVTRFGSRHLQQATKLKQELNISRRLYKNMELMLKYLPNTQTHHYNSHQLVVNSFIDGEPLILRRYAEMRMFWYMHKSMKLQNSSIIRIQL